MRTLVQAAARRRRQLGYTLLETVAVLAIAALVAASIMYFILTANNAQKTNEAMSQLASVQQVVRSLFAGQPDYEGLTASLLANSRQLPNRMVRGSDSTASLQHAFNGPITVGTYNSNQFFTVQFAGLPGDACTKIATMDLGTGLFSIEVSGASTVTLDEGRPLNPGEANEACGTSNNTSITWTFY